MNEGVLPEEIKIEDMKTNLKISLLEKQILDLISSDPKVPIPEIAKKLGKGITVTKLLPGNL